MIILPAEEASSSPLDLENARTTDALSKALVDRYDIADWEAANLIAKIDRDLGISFTERT